MSNITVSFIALNNEEGDNVYNEHTQPTNPETVANLVTKPFRSNDHKNNTCSICLDQIQEGQACTTLPCDCKRCFHKDCILEWVKVGHKCPICNYELPASQTAQPNQTINMQYQTISNTEAAINILNVLTLAQRHSARQSAFRRAQPRFENVNGRSSQDTEMYHIPSRMESIITNGTIHELKQQIIHLGGTEESIDQCIERRELVQLLFQLMN